MPGFYVLVLAIVAAFLVSATLTRLLMHYAGARRLMDLPNARSAHHAPTPRGGGLAIAVTCQAAVVFALVVGLIEVSTATALLAAGIALAGVGWIDDHDHVRASVRLAVHFGAGTLLVALIGPVPLDWLDLGPIPQAVEFGVSVVGTVWLINLFNFMDGIDGIAGAEAVFVSAGFAACVTAAGAAAGPAWLAVLWSAASGGFLLWNWPPAKIFMGDVGSGFLGGALAALILMGGQLEPRLAVATLVLVGIFAADTTVAVIRRAARRVALHEAHNSHAFQRLARRWGSHLPVTVGAIGINVFLLLPIALAVATDHIDPLPAVVGTYAALMAAAFFAGSGQSDQRQKLMQPRATR